VETTVAEKQLKVKKNNAHIQYQEDSWSSGPQQSTKIAFGAKFAVCWAPFPNILRCRCRMDPGQK